MNTPQPLYTKDILRLAMSLPLEQHLAAADGTGEARSASCGSRVQAHVMLNGARIAKAVMKVSSCALGQASAAILLKYAQDLDVASLAKARAAMAQGLNCGDWQENWPELEHLKPAQSYTARHSAILIPYDALLNAVHEALSKQVNS